MKGTAETVVIDVVCGDCKGTEFDTDGRPEVASDCSYIDLPVKCASCGNTFIITFQPTDTIK